MDAHGRGEQEGNLVAVFEFKNIQIKCNHFFLSDYLYLGCESNIFLWIKVLNPLI